MIQTSKYKKILMLFIALYPFVSFAQLTTITFSGIGVLTSNNWTTHSGTTGQLTTLATPSDVGNSLSYSGLPTSTNNRTTTIAGNSEDVNYAVSTIANDGSVYYSALIKLPNITGQAANTTTGNYFMTLSDTNGAVVTTGFVGRLYVRAGATANTFNLGVLNNTGSSASAANIYGTSPIDYAINTTYLVVVKYTYSTNTASIWVNPTVSATEPTALFTTNFGTGAAPTKSKGIVIRQAGTATAGTGNIEIDEIRVSNNWSAVLGLLPTNVPSYVPKNGLLGYWPFNGNANDSSGNGLISWAVGTTYIADKNGNPNSAISFTPTSYVNIPANFTLNNSKGLTFASWVNFNSIIASPGNGNTIVDFSDGNCVNCWSYRYYIVQDANKIHFGREGSSGGSGFRITANRTIASSTWYYVVGTIDTLTGQASLFINGTLEVSSNANTNPISISTGATNSKTFGMATLAPNNSNQLNGNLDNIGIWNRALTQSEITALYNQTSNPVLPSYVPTTGLVGYWPFSGNANDASGSGNNGVVNGATLTTDKSGNLNSAFSFDGINDYIQTANPGPTGTGMSVSFWMKSPQRIQNTNILEYGGNQWGSYFNVAFNDWAGSSSCYGITFEVGGALISRGNSIGLDSNIWHHCVLILPTNAASLNAVTFYIDGNLLSGVCSYANYGAPAPSISSLNQIRIGRGWQRDGYYKGLLDDIGIWNRALTQSEITALYNQAPIPVLPSNIPTSGLLAYYPFNGNANDLSGNAYNLTQVGTNVVAKNDRFNNLNSSYYFGGANPENKFNFPTSFYPAYNSLNSGSISFWMNIDSIVDHSHYFGFDNTFFVKQKNGQNSESYIGLSNGKIRFHMTGALPASNMQVDVKQLVTKKWYNLTVSWTPSNLYIYIDGLLSSSFSGNFGLSNTPSPDFISIGGFYGTGGTGCYSSIDDFGIWNRALTQSEITALYNMPNTSTNDTLSIVNTQSDTLIFPNKIKVSLKSNDLSAKNIISYEIKLSYDQTKLIFDSVSLNNTASANGLIVTNNNTSGILKFVWARSTKLTGTLPLLNCFFSPIDSGKSKINISYFLFNTDTVRNLKSKTLINKYNFGDIDLNNYIQAYDGMVALRYSVGMDPIPLIDPLPWENWRVKVASVDSSAIVTANDASLILKYVVGLINQFPKRGLNYSNGYVLTSIENNEIVFRSFGNLQGLNVSFLNQFDKLNPASFIFSNDAISAVNILDNIYKVGIAFNNSPEPGSIILKIPIKGELKNDLNVELYENENKRLVNLNKSTSITSESKTNHLIFPNPTTNLINIIGLGKTETEVSIYDIQGKLILTRKIIDQGIIDMSDLYNGVYLLKIGEVVHRVTKL